MAGKKDHSIEHTPSVPLISLNVNLSPMLFLFVSLLKPIARTATATAKATLLFASVVFAAPSIGSPHVGSQQFFVEQSTGHVYLGEQTQRQLLFSQGLCYYNAEQQRLFYRTLVIQSIRMNYLLFNLSCAQSAYFAYTVYECHFVDVMFMLNASLQGPSKTVRVISPEHV